jgi:hypothetical protein
LYNRSLITEEPKHYHKKKKKDGERMKKNNLIQKQSKHLITKPALYTTTLLLLTACLLPLVSASTPTLHLPDQPVTMTVYDGSGSYFDIDLSDVPADHDIDNGYYEGWCADRSVVMPRGEKLTVQVCHSDDPAVPIKIRQKNWGKINYILNHKNGASMNDVQDAFWYLLCDYPYASLSSTAQMLADTAQADYLPEPGDLIAILLKPIRNESNPWPVQFAFLQVNVPSQEPTDDEEPIIPAAPTRISHGLHYNTLTPIADANGPYNAICNERIECDGSASYDPDGLLISYKWSFGDGTSAEGKTASHSYPHPGIYKISLTVIDNFGISDSDTTNATVIQPNRPPTNLIIGCIANGTINTEYSSAFGSIDEDDDTIAYTIAWGDGTTNQTGFLLSGECFSLFHQWDTPGNYTITLTATDGVLTAVAEKDVTIHETFIADNIWLVGLALLAIIALLSILLYSQKKKNTK